jgi:predicted metal-dependent hydrolase
MVFLLLWPSRTVRAQAMVQAATSPSQIATYVYAHAMSGITLNAQQQDSAKRVILRAATETLALDMSAPMAVVKKQVDAILARRDSLLRGLLRDNASRQRLTENIESM